jgi:hypothetical protein
MSQEKIDRLNFYTHLYKETKGGSIEVRMIDNDGRVNRKFYDLNHFKKDLHSMACPIDENCYFAVATRNGGGTKDHIRQIPALWCDIDFKGIEQKNADKLIAESPSPSSAIVKSGGGYHLYWFLKEPLEKSDIPLVESLNLKLAAYYQADLVPAEAARVLRIPGSINIKYDPPRPVVLKNLDPTRRYDPDDFDWLTAAYPASAHTRAYNNERMHSMTQVVSGQSVVNDHNRPQVTTSDHIGFSEGQRDNTLFHLANHLVKGVFGVRAFETQSRVFLMGTPVLT